MEEYFGEGEELSPIKVPQVSPKSVLPSTAHFVIQDRKLTYTEAARCLNTLGKDESGVRYAYLMITATERGLTDISSVTNFKHVLYVDVSGNFLKLQDIQELAALPYLLYLKADRNRIESADLTPMPYLQVLILNKNQITETCDINQPILETLELGSNSIYTAQFDCSRVPNITELCLQENHLLDTSGTYPPKLEKLYLGYNKITKIHRDLCKLTFLRVLHLRGNNIRKLTGFTETLLNLSYLNVRDNKINKLRQFRKLSCLPKLDTLIVLGNPFYGGREKENIETEETENEETTYRDSETVEEHEETVLPSKIKLSLLVLLPNLKRINKELVTSEELEIAEKKKRSISDAIFEEESSEEETEPSTTDFTTDFTTETETKLGSKMLSIDDEEDGGEETDEFE